MRRRKIRTNDGRAAVEGACRPLYPMLEKPALPKAHGTLASRNAISVSRKCERPTAASGFMSVAASARRRKRVRCESEADELDLDRDRDRESTADSARWNREANYSSAGKRNFGFIEGCPRTRFLIPDSSFLIQRHDRIDARRSARRNVAVAASETRPRMTRSAGQGRGIGRRHAEQHGRAASRPRSRQRTTSPIDHGNSVSPDAAARRSPRSTRSPDAPSASRMPIS